MIVKNIFIEEKSYEIVIGGNAKENDQIIKESHPMDLWFHLSNVPSAHLVLKSKGDKIPRRYINEISVMLFENNKKYMTNTNVIYTEIRNVKRTDVPGCVITKKVETIRF
jgi:predicted ribosome quality control (RQC) complex YloA/Tae2 family protein